jgi:hypothetical protein
VADRAEQRRQERARRKALRLDHDGDVAFMVAWSSADPADLEAARKDTHDRLIGWLGSRRTSGVTWSHFSGDGAREQLSRLSANETAGSDQWNYYRRLRGLLREYDGFIVIAYANARKG